MGVDPWLRTNRGEQESAEDRDRIYRIKQNPFCKLKLAVYPSSLVATLAIYLLCRRQVTSELRRRRKGSPARRSSAEAGHSANIRAIRAIRGRLVPLIRVNSCSFVVSTKQNSFPIIRNPTKDAQSSAAVCN